MHRFVSRGSYHIDGVSDDTNERIEPGIKFGFISQFSNEWSMIIKYKKEYRPTVLCCKQTTVSMQRAFGGSVMKRDIRN